MSRLISFHQKLLSDPTGTFLTGLVFSFLIPFSLLYGVGNWLRLLCYHYGLLPSFESSIPVISVGNLTAGGTGKTPVVDWLVKHLMEKGYHPAIVSRGYGGQFRGEVGFVSDGNQILMNPVDSGDEPVLLAQRNPQVPVLIARKRVNAIKEIERTACADIIVLDDAFQHLAVRRDVDLVLVDALRPFGNGWPLPAGNLRGFRHDLERADIILRTRCADGMLDLHSRVPTFRSFHCFATEAISLNGEVVPMEKLKRFKLTAFAGIADPDGFFSALEKSGMQLIGKKSLPDHENYPEKIIAKINKLSKTSDALATTEKDAIKLKASMFQLPCYKISLSLKVLDVKNFLAVILDKVRRKK
ncbi:tetraacyldisaccharide 4'-kinase [Pelovirga terrestris]|uniref:Tetraacyldisaccharide 4'-kinase n=1 Tax=Pelovirga terrestris TaxID=2771352 RepID=A0A8J6QY81_9BACT|nr:tetraacyldisaccharide 4'-kinase [Pelovirga terrestris]MBD1401013.1 tetraacyldisaccharide 4'-kinase [Pelovirga terrestris]